MSNDDTTLNPYQAPASAGEVAVEPAADQVLAGRGRRLGAHLLDSLLVFLALLPALPAMLEQDDSISTAGLIFMGVAVLVMLGLQLKYLYENGQSIGKRIVGIRIVRLDGSRCSLGRILFMRNLVIMVIAYIPVVGNLVNFADPLFIFREDRRCLHDLIADTKVVTA